MYFIKLKCYCDQGIVRIWPVRVKCCLQSKYMFYLVAIFLSTGLLFYGTSIIINSILRKAMWKCLARRQASRVLKKKAVTSWASLRYIKNVNMLYMIYIMYIIYKQIRCLNTYTYMHICVHVMYIVYTYEISIYL